MTMGPVQMLVVGFDEPHFTGAIAAELDKLREQDVIRLVDMLVVQKDDAGNVTTLQRSDLSAEDAAEFGAIVGALIGFGAAGDEGAELGAEAGAEAMEDGHVFDDDQVWYVADSIPNGTAAAVALLEHRWAIPLRGAIRGAGGALLADSWVHPTDLVAVGLAAAAE